MVEQDKTSEIDVPGHILDKVAEIADWYAQNNQVRWLDGFSDEQKEEIIEGSSHNNVAERRELHRAILQQAASHIAGGMPERPMMFYIGGPLGTGKTELRDSFDERVDLEQSQGVIEPFDNEHLEAVFQKYKEARARLMGPDYDVFKAGLPEYMDHKEEHGHNYAFALIRAEATGLGAAIKAWATELNAHTILEELGDGLTDEWLERNVGDKELIVVGSTAELSLVRLRLQEREGAVDDSTIAKQYRGFSQDDGYSKWARHAALSVLVDSGASQDFKVIHAARDRETVEEDQAAMSMFRSYADMLDEQIFQMSNPDQPAGGSEEPDQFTL